MEGPLFSIITITYNAAKELPVTMKSVASQRFRDFEHIMIDGASTDSSLSVARKYGIKELKILSEPDNGLYDAMNKGMKMAKGKYLIFLNAGDSFASPLSLSEYADAALKSNPDIIYGDTEIVDDSGKVLRPRHLYAPVKLTFDSFSHGMLICHQSFCVKRELAPEYDTSYKYSSDYDWTIRCIKRTSPDKCVNLHGVMIHYLDNGLTEMYKSESLRERFGVMRKHYGVVTTVLRHLQFIPRALQRKIKM